MSNDREPFGWPFAALKSPKVEIRDADAVEGLQRREPDRRLDKLSPRDALDWTLTDFLAAKGNLVHALRRVGGSDAVSVAKFAEKTGAEIMVATYALLAEL
jgi:hypothetical protein